MNAKVVMDALRRHQPAGRYHRHLQPAHARHRAQLLRPHRGNAGRSHRPFDGTPDLLTNAMAREIYGAEAEEAFNEAATSTAIPTSEPAPARVPA